VSNQDHCRESIALITFQILSHKHGDFCGKLRNRLPRLPQQATWQVGYLVDKSAAMNGRGLGTSWQSFGGRYPRIHPREFNRQKRAHYDPGIVKDIQTQLRDYTTEASLKKVMETVVGIQESILMLGLDKVMSASGTALKGASRNVELCGYAIDASKWSYKAAEKFMGYYDWLSAKDDWYNPFDDKSDPVDKMLIAL